MSRWKPDAPGRLVKAAITLFDERGYEATTVAEIAEAAGLTKRTFFRYFADKREVLFMGSGELRDIWVQAVRDAPPEATAIMAMDRGLDAVAELFGGRHAFARIRARIIAANPELQERELIKLATLAVALAEVLRRRGVGDPAADLAAEAGVAVFRIAFQNWVDPTNDRDFGELVRESVAELRSVTAGGQPAAGRAFAAATEA
jgi:AcrR family transcriptional regulator